MGLGLRTLRIPPDPFPSSTLGETLPAWQPPRITATEKTRLVMSRRVLVVTL